MPEFLELNIASQGTLVEVKNGVNVLNTNLTAARAAKVDNLDTAVSTRASSAEIVELKNLIGTVSQTLKSRMDGVI